MARAAASANPHKFWAIWDPIQLATKFSSPVVVILGLLTVLVATVSVNVAANAVSPSYDFSNAAPPLVSFRIGGLITGVLAVALQPWRLLASPHIYIFVWLGFYGGLLGAVAGVLGAGYWIINRTQLDLAALYQAGGRYWFAAGWNWRAVVATVAGAVLAVGGAWSAPGQGPFPAGGLIPFLKPLYDYSWVVGFASAFLVYLITTVVVPPSRGARSGRDRQGRTDPAAVDG